MEKDLQEIENIIFGIYSAEEIKSIAVCEVNSPKLCSVDKNTGYGTVYDPRMGTLENGKACETCGQNVWQCSGHYGYIELNEAIIHPLFYRRVVDFLKCICLKCNKLMITEDQIDLNGFNKILSTKRFTKILEKIEKIDICSHCSYSQPDIKYLSTDNTISMVYKQKNKKKISIILPVDEIKKIFDNISDDDVKLLGFNPSLMHPRNLILTVFPVIPPTARPYIIADGQMCDDDLTIQIVEIIKANNHLKVGDEPIPEVKRQRASQSLKFRISTFYNNSCLAPDTPVLMWDGSIKRADQIEMDDELVGDDGTKRIVKYTCSGEDDMYEITQEKGDKYIVNKEHYVTFKFSGHKNIMWVKANNNSPNGYYFVRWFDLYENKVKSKTVSVLKNRNKKEAYEIIKNYIDKISSNDVFDISIKNYLKIPKSYHEFFMGLKLSTPIKWDNKELLLDPYILGLWLGDGNSNGKGFTTEDIEILEHWKKWGIDNDAEIVLYPHKLNDSTQYINFRYHEYQESDPSIYRPDIHFGIKSKYNINYNRTNPSPLKYILNKYNLINNKHIPEDFIYNSYDNRLKLLAGLIDTDGYVSKSKKSIVISQCALRKKLIEQIDFIAKSLGFYSNVTEIYKTFNNKKYKGYSVYISGNIDIVPTVLLRKKCYTADRNGTKSNFKVKYIGKGNYNGFGVDKNHRFLLGDYTITHNSGKAKHTTNGRSIKGLKERLTSKDGLIRSNLMGKRCCAKGTKIILWNGEIKNVEDIKIGDNLIGNDGEKRTVIKLFNGTDNMYKIKQGTKKSVKDDYIVNSEHILSFKFIHNKTIQWINSLDSYELKWFDKQTMTEKSKRLKATINRTKEEAYEEMKEFVNNLDDNNTINIPVLEYLKLSDKIKKKMYGYKIEKPVNWEYKKVDIDPYIFGMWLGDGYKNGKTFTTIDKELVNYWEKWTNDNNMSLSFYEDGSNIHYGIKNKDSSRKTTYFKEKLTKYGVLNNKFIPKEYLTNSKEVRLALLAGLIDTDGSVEQGGVTIRISQGLMHKAIIDGARFIADSLGFQTSINRKKTTWKHDGVKKYGDAYVLTISGHGAENIPTILPRKKCRSPLIAGNNWTKIKVEPCGVGEFYGFEIDGNNLFVLPDFTVLHNCEQTGRTVIGPDPTLRMGEIGVPKEMATNLTVPIQVTNYNFNYLTNLIDEGKVERVFSDKIDQKTGKKETITFYLKEALFSRGTILQQGDVIIRTDEKTGEESEIIVNNGKDLLQPGDKLKRNGELVPELRYPGKKHFNLKIGDICERQLTNGDILLLNPKY